MLLLGFVRIGLLVCAVALGIWIDMGPLGLAGLVLIGVSILAAAFSPSEARILPCALAGAWGGFIGTACLLLATGRNRLFDGYYALFPWLFALAILLDIPGGSVRPKQHWRNLGVTMAFLGCAVCVIAAYLQNLTDEFYFGLFVTAVLSIRCFAWFKVPSLGIIVINTMLLLFAGITVTEACNRIRSHFNTGPVTDKEYYRYEIATKDPHGYFRWLNYYGHEVDPLLSGY
jgi:hypothetical protein